MTEKRSYYLTELCDEGGEVGGTLERIAEDLRDRDLRPSPPGDGEAFPAYRVLWRYYPCPRQPDGSYTVPRDYEGRAHAFAYSDGGGWNPDVMLDWSDAMKERIRASNRTLDPTDEERRADEISEAERVLREEGSEPVEWLVCDVGQETGTVTFRADPPRCEWSDEQ